VQRMGREAGMCCPPVSLPATTPPTTHHTATTLQQRAASASGYRACVRCRSPLITNAGSLVGSYHTFAGSIYSLTALQRIARTRSGLYLRCAALFASCISVGLGS